MSLSPAREGAGAKLDHWKGLGGSEPSQGGGADPPARRQNTEVGEKAGGWNTMGHMQAGELGKRLRTGTQNSTDVPSLLLGCWASSDFKASAQYSACSQKLQARDKRSDSRCPWAP